MGGFLGRFEGQRGSGPARLQRKIGISFFLGGFHATIKANNG
jgi:hypothetical protein